MHWSVSSRSRRPASVTPGVTAYAGYAEANRAPTPAELGCSDPERPCTLASFFVSDPPLKQVVTYTWEGGLRGRFDAWGEGRVGWNVGLFRTDSDDDIINVASPIQGRGFFQNAGTTRRQGAEAGLSFANRSWSAYVDYAFVDATFRDSLSLNSPNNPFAGPDGIIQVSPGDHLPGIPEQRVKVGLDYGITEKWVLGGTFTYNSGQFLRGDEANQNAKIPDYSVVNLHTRYRVLPNFEVFGLVQNLFDEKYATFGTFADVTGVTFTEGTVTDPRTVSPAQPFGAFAGVRIKF